MGGDGGTIPKRKDRVKTKSRSEPRNNYDVEGERDPLERWKLCALSGYPIRRPVMSSQSGHILSKEGVIEYLLKKRAHRSETWSVREGSSPVCDVLQKMSDVIELKLKDNTALTNGDIPSEDKYKMGSFICPITGLETNGKYRFVFSWKCGCVISERALKECEDDSKLESRKCLICEQPYEPSDLVLINPMTQKELEENQMNCMTRKMVPHHQDKKTAHIGSKTSSGDSLLLSNPQTQEPYSLRSSTEESSDSTSKNSSRSSRYKLSESSSKRNSHIDLTASSSGANHRSVPSESSSSKHAGLISCSSSEKHYSRSTTSNYERSHPSYSDSLKRKASSFARVPTSASRDSKRNKL